ncbi:gp53-like domain-containing protein [Pseudomonas sp. MDT1-17]
MDYPNSVPSAGLVNGKFVDENPLMGTPGSLIPARWGNSVTDEIVNVITAAGLVPAEADSSQLRAAISAIVEKNKADSFASKEEAESGASSSRLMTPLRVFQAIEKKVVQATESIFGWARIASQAQVNAAADDTTIVTPKKLCLGVSYSFAENGYIAFPAWLGGFMIQWVQVSISVNGGYVSKPWPLAFKNQCRGAWASYSHSGNAPFVDITTAPLVTYFDASQVQVMSNSGGTGWIAVLSVGN